MCTGNAQTIRVTHPFHPLYGKKFIVVERGLPWGHDSVWYTDEAGVFRRLPTAWTSLVEPDPWVVLSGGRSAFRLEDLLSLVDLVDDLRGR